MEVLVAFLMNDELTGSIVHKSIRLVLAEKAMNCLLAALFGESTLWGSFLDIRLLTGF